MQNKGDIEFVWAKKNEYPLAYIRSDANKKVLVIINPAQKEVVFEFDKELKETIYLFGKEAVQNGKQVIVKPCSAGWYLL